MRIFEYAVIYIPKKSEKDSDKASIIVPVTAVLASDHAKATLLASRSIPDKYIEMLDQIEVVVRPF